MTGLETFGINTAQNAASGLIGMAIGGATAKWNDKRQLEMQQKLQEMQEAGNKRMANYTQGLNKEMWDYTNYENQMKHMKAAGLNPALMYGQGGGGGSTANGGSAGSVNAPKAATPGNEVLGMTIAQRKLIEAQTENVKADTAKKSRCRYRPSERARKAGEKRGTILHRHIRR